MSSDLNRVTQIGRLVQDPEMRHTSGGTAVCNFSIASNQTHVSNEEKKETTSFFTCIAWGKLAEIMTEHCKKGHRIGIDGRLQQRSWKDRDDKPRSTVEIVVENFQFLQPKKDESHTDGVPNF